MRENGFKSWWSSKEVRIGGGSALECDERGSEVFRIKVRIKEWSLPTLPFVSDDALLFSRGSMVFSVPSPD